MDVIMKGISAEKAMAFRVVDGATSLQHSPSHIFDIAHFFTYSPNLSTDLQGLDPHRSISRDKGTRERERERERET
jgi:hypothetical protein